MPSRFPLPIEPIAITCERFQVAKLSLFGSALRDDFHDDSDLDMLVEFLPESLPSYFTLVRLKRELTEITGREVDLHTPSALSKYIRERVIGSAEAQYVHR